MTTTPSRVEARVIKRNKWGAVMRIGVIGAALCLCFVGVSHAQSAHAAIRKDLNVPAESLGAALQDIAKVYDLQLLYHTELAKDLKTQGAIGSFTPDDALNRVLSGTGLTYKFLDSKTITVYPTSSQSTQNASSRSSDDTANGGGKKTSQDFRVAQVDQGAIRSSTVTTTTESYANNPNGGPGLTEIIVTAQKREERLIDTPQSVSVLTAEDLARLGATQFRDFANTIPGLSFTTAGAGWTQVVLRGVTTGSDGSSTVGVYVDDVPYGSSTNFANGVATALDVGLFDMDRIEVLRGPQGTLYGASAMGGVLKYVTKQPDPTDFSETVQAGVSGTEHGGVSYNTAAAVNIPIVSGVAAVRASGYESRDGGYIDNIALGQKDVNSSDIYGGRLDLLVLPTDALTIRMGGFLQNISRDGEGTVDYTVSGAPEYGALDQSRRLPEPFFQQFRLGSSTITYNFGPATLTSVSSYQQSSGALEWDYSAALLPYTNGPPPDGLGENYRAVGFTTDWATDKFTQEVRLASSGTQTFEWLVGGFYTNENSNRHAAYDPRGPSLQPEPNYLYTFSVPSRFGESAAFGDLTWHLNSKFDVTGGVRYAQDRQRFEQIGSGAFGSSTPLTHSSDDATTYLADARYHFSDHATGYLRYATGFRPGGPNYAATNPATGLPIGPATFAPDNLKSYEIGYKAETAGGRLSIDIDAYDIDWRNIQIIEILDGFGFYTNAPGGATSRGSELSLTARPSPGFIVSWALAYQDAYLDQANYSLGASEGERLPNVAHFTASANADYMLPVSNFKPTVGSSVRYVDGRTSGFDNTVGNVNVSPQYQLPPYTTVDLRGGLTFTSVVAQVYIHNLFDSRGQLSEEALPFTRVTILQPRTVGMTITARF
jgi:iron complex outermembrane receptor protein